MTNPFEAQAAGLPQQFVQMTLQSEQVCHYIRDDELENLGKMRHDPVMEIFLLAAGAAVGAIVPAFQELARFNASQNPMGITGLMTVIVLVAALAIATVTGLLWWQRTAAKSDLVTEIRGRPKVRVMVNHDNAA